MQLIFTYFANFRSSKNRKYVEKNFLEVELVLLNDFLCRSYLNFGDDFEDNNDIMIGMQVISSTESVKIKLISTCLSHIDKNASIHTQ
ncbi:hypothetical protein BpHYR1_040155 [Brachionus plicatilis]|uniref:Uncharacterized protein n=1 Tax=Brachionus plicatilis TaxID=10195 RepID=A0A3M7SJN6_BRAPC|nr:hypothetical protein BpHYR1_040155 [Brachionus plicatilis]